MEPIDHKKKKMLKIIYPSAILLMWTIVEFGLIGKTVNEVVEKKLRKQKL